MLRRCYTQNIDGLESRAGVPASKLVDCHGSLNTASCRRCGKSKTCAELLIDVDAKRVPVCGVLGCDGVMKPDVTFFGESLSPRVSQALEADRDQCDLLLVIGTSLQVAPISHVMGYMPPKVPQILINKHLVQPPARDSDGFDFHLLGPCDNIVRHILDRNTSAPAAIAHRGAVWGLAGDEVLQGVAELTAAGSSGYEEASAADTFELVTCDSCGVDIGEHGSVWVCGACFGTDICGECFATGTFPASHRAHQGESHVFHQER